MRVVTVCLLGLLTIVVVAEIILLVTFVSNARRTVDCLQQNAAELNTSIVAGRTAAAQDRAAQRELLLTPSTTPAEGKAAVQRFLQRLDDADEARTANPPPVRTCN